MLSIPISGKIKGKYGNKKKARKKKKKKLEKSGNSGQKVLPDQKGPNPTGPYTAGQRGNF